MQGYIAVGRKTRDYLYFTCPKCGKVRDSETEMMLEYSSVYEIGSKEPIPCNVYDFDRGIQGYVECCGIFIIDPFVKPEEIDELNAPNNLMLKVNDLKSRYPIYNEDGSSIYVVRYVKIKEIVPGCLLEVKCDNKLERRDLERLLENPDNLDKQLMQELGVEDDEGGWGENVTDKFNFSFPANGYNVSDCHGFNVYESSESAVAKCKSNTGKYFVIHIWAD